MLLIIDYDETYTESPALWNDLINNALVLGWTVVCCTNRVGNTYVDADVIKAMEAIDIEVVFAATHDDKREAMRQAGYDTTNAIWIDDRPEYIGDLHK